MIKECNVNNIDEFVDLAYRKNNKPEHNSAFCGKKHSTIKEEFFKSLTSKEHILIGNYEDGILKGILNAYIDEEKYMVDIAGPFTDNGDYCSISNKLFNQLKESLKSSYRYNFFFDKRNIECIGFMNSIGAENQGNECVFVLKRENYEFRGYLEKANKLTHEWYEDFIQLHDSIFRDMYLSGNDIINSLDKNREVFYIRNQKELIGYAGLKTHPSSNRSTVEVVAVDEKYRKKGYGKVLLNTLLYYGFKDEKIDDISLVVENKNTAAIQLYYSFGFDLEVENCYYQLTTEGNL